MQALIQCYVEIRDGGCIATCVKCKKRSPHIKGTRLNSRTRAAASLRNVCPEGGKYFYREMSAADVVKRKIFGVSLRVVMALMVIATVWVIVRFSVK